MGTRFGVVREGRYLLWGWNHGLMLPRPFAFWLVQGWNRIACRLWGHDDTLWHLAQRGEWGQAPQCGHCSRPLRGCTGTGYLHLARKRP